MNGTVLLAVVAAVLVVAVLTTGSVIIVRRRRTAAAGDSEAKRREAGRRAIEKVAKESRGKKGSLRGKGQGGNDGLARDLYSGSDFGGPGI